MPYQCITRQESRICYVLPDCVTSTGLRFDWIIICPPLGLYLHTNQRKCKVNIWISQNTRGQHITTLKQDNSNYGRETGWQKLAAFRRRQKWPSQSIWKTSATLCSIILTVLDFYHTNNTNLWLLSEVELSLPTMSKKCVITHSILVW